jgi:hypothetical protein
MPPPRTWLPRIDEILSTLRASTVEFYDRTGVERLFEVQRRTAILLMNAAGPQKTGTGSMVLTSKLIIFVEDIQANHSQDVSRREITLKHLDVASTHWKGVRAQVTDASLPSTFPVTDEIRSTVFSGLSKDIEIRRGRITIRFEPDDPLDACTKLYALSMALTNDFGGFIHALKEKAASKEATINNLLESLESQRSTHLPED